ncbi:MAG: aldehyde ferredoxin oxidoreductase family protein, partial [Anaerolineae bacterium]
MYGYMGRILLVDLTDRRLEDIPLSAEYARQYLGGSGLAARYLYDLVDAGVGPLEPASPLLFMTGPLVGTRAPSCGRFEVCARSPLTSFWGEGNAGGFWGPALRFAGYDGIIVQGAAERPVYLLVRDGRAELRDAEHLWGMDTYAVQRALQEEAGDSSLKVAAIGLAGEKLSPLAVIVNAHGRTAGRGGMGAVMGSKKLKAIAVGGRQKVPLADPERFQAAAKEALAILQDDIPSQMLHLGGTAFYVDLGMLEGDVPSKYYTQGVFPGAERLSGATMADTILRRARTCFGCAVACGRETSLPRFGVEAADGPEYETIASYGTQLLSDDLEGVAYAGHLCNVYGLDTISAGSTIAFIYYLFEQGIVSAGDLDGLEPRWGDIGPAITLTEWMARRQGIGDLLAQGSRAAAEHFGVPELAVHVSGMEVAMHDPRAYIGMALTYATSPRPGCHMQGDMYMLDSGDELPEWGMAAGARDEQSAEKARMTALRQDWRCVTNSLIQCHLVHPPLELVLTMLNAAAGWDMDADELRRCGERIFNLKRLLNLRWGLTPAHDR